MFIQDRKRKCEAKRNVKNVIFNRRKRQNDLKL